MKKNIARGFSDGNSHSAMIPPLKNFFAAAFSLETEIALELNGITDLFN